LYAYVFNKPVDLVDPFGLSSCGGAGGRFLDAYANSFIQTNNALAQSVYSGLNGWPFTKWTTVITTAAALEGAVARTVGTPGVLGFLFGAKPVQPIMGPPFGLASRALMAVGSSVVNSAVVLSALEAGITLGSIGNAGWEAATGKAPGVSFYDWWNSDDSAQYMSPARKPLGSGGGACGR
jgi:hypothetical protein